VVVCELVGTGEKAEGLRARGYEVVSLLPSGNVRSAYVNFIRLRRFVAARGIDVLHSHSAASLADAALCRMLRPSLKVVHTFHFGNYPHVDSSIKRLERASHRFADVLVAVGHRQADTIRETYGLPAGRLRTIWNGIDQRPSRLDEQLLAPYLGQGRIIIGTIGTFFEQKGHVDLLEVAAILKQRGVPATFLVVGAGPLYEPIRARSRALGLDGYVEFLGWVKDASELILPAVDVFFQPSRWEAMSMVLLEAAAAGKPIVCTDVGDASRILTDGQSGFITAPTDIPTMADRLQRLVGDYSLRKQFGAAARAVVDSRCTADVMVRQYELLYEELAGCRTMGETAA
jgi:glycosyltransferase involved in cell wall biosynthesis